MLRFKNVLSCYLLLAGFQCDSYGQSGVQDDVESWMVNENTPPKYISISTYVGPVSHEVDLPEFKHTRVV